VISKKAKELVSHNKFIQAVRMYIQLLLSWRSIITFGLSTLGNFLYDNISWMLLQLIVAEVTIDTLTLAGHVASRIDNCIVMDSAAVCIGGECTYIRLILIGIPFAWRGDSLARDVLRIIFFIWAVSIANVARLCVTLLWLAKGVSWKYAHDFVNHLTYGPILALLLFLWLKAMKSRLLKSSEINYNEKQPNCFQISANREVS
jgi:hypothetical protein